MQLHHAAYAASCRHTPMTHAYTGASCSIARTIRTWTQLTHAHNRYARSQTTPERDQTSGRACDGFIPNNHPLNPTLSSCTHRSVTSSSALASRASSFFSLRQSRAKWPRTPQLKHLPIDDFFDFCRAHKRLRAGPTHGPDASSLGAIRSRRTNTVFSDVIRTAWPRRAPTRLTQTVLDTSSTGSPPASDSDAQHTR
jgi:hypothetical protein